jgi:hypothetical protein
MSLMLFGQSEPEPTPEEPAHDSRRRYLIILATVIAVILGGGSAAFLLLNSGPKINRTAPNTYTPPTDATSTGGPDTASASVSPTASPSRSPSPSRSASARPSASGATPVVFRVSPDHLCPSVDFAPVEQVAGSPSTAPNVDNHTDKSNYVDYHCEATYGKVKAFVDAMIFNDAESASASYTGNKSADQATIAGVEQLGGIGSDAYGYVASTRYVIWATQGNMVFKIYVNATGGVPPPGRLRDPAIASAKGTIPRLRA